MSSLLFKSLIVFSMVLNAQSAPLTSRAITGYEEKLTTTGTYSSLTLGGWGKTGDWKSLDVSEASPIFEKYTATAESGALSAKLAFSKTTSLGIIVADGLDRNTPASDPVKPNVPLASGFMNELVEKFMSAHSVTLKHLAIPNIVEASTSSAMRSIDLGHYAKGTPQYNGIMASGLGKLAGRLGTPTSVFVNYGKTFLIFSYVPVSPPTDAAAVSTPTTSTATSGGASGSGQTVSAPVTPAASAPGKKMSIFQKIKKIL